MTGVMVITSLFLVVYLEASGIRVARRLVVVGRAWPLIASTGIPWRGPRREALDGERELERDGDLEMERRLGRDPRNGDLERRALL